MNETPEAVRERVKQEELAKGSDPRVAESRSKAAEARAKHGLPIDPQQAWKAKLEQEGGGGRPAAAAPVPAETEAPAEEPEAPTETPEAPPQAPAPAPSPAAPAPAAPDAAPGPPSPVGAPQVVGIARPAMELSDPEVGELIEAPEIETVYVGGGVSARTGGIPAWLIGMMAAIIAWSLMYLVVFGTTNPVRETTGCIVKPDATFTCFNPKSVEEGGEAGGH